MEKQVTLKIDGFNKDNFSEEKSSPVQMRDSVQKRLKRYALEQETSSVNVNTVVIDRFLKEQGY